MKILLLSTLILSTALSYGQSNSTSSENASKGFQLGLNASPDYCYRTMPSYFEVPKLGYTLGLNTAYQFNQLFSVETGLHYSNKGTQTSMLDLVFIQPEPLVPNQAKYIYNYHFIDIPLKANFTVGSRKIRFFTSVGLTTNFFIKETQTNVYVYSDRTEINTISPNFTDFRKVNFTPTLSAGIDWSLHPNLNLRVEPTAQYSAFTMTNTPLTGHLFSAGLKMSVYYRL
ncbi:MAG: outer membrane protein beta-barrel domain [Bacteroidota bacterium]|jgi:hypothetical protein